MFIHLPCLKSFQKPGSLFISTHSGRIEQLTLGYDEFYSPLELLKNYDIEKFDHKISNSYLKARISVCTKSHEMYLNDENKIYMRSIDLMIITRCSLNVKASNLMQYYVDSKNTDYENILQSLNILSQNVDEIAEFRIIGGEPLMNRAFSNRGGNKDRYPGREIFVYTNGTIAPRDDKELKGKKVNFIITEYENCPETFLNCTSNLINLN